MNITTFQIPPKILCGDGSVKEAGPQAALLGKKAMVVMGGSSAKKNGSLDKLLASLDLAGVAHILFDKVPSDPDVVTVEEGVAKASQFQAEVIIALGGGSALDAGKAMAMLLTNGGNVAHYAKNPVTKKALPFIAIPTTAGTGSEITKITVITDNAQKLKMPILSELIIPDVAILDTELTLSMPPHITAATGMDALTHAIEAYISRRAFPLTDIFALKAIEMLSQNILTAAYNPTNTDAKRQMMYGQMYAGMAFSNSSVALVHSMSRPLGAHFGIPHGHANAILLPAVMGFNQIACLERMKDVATAMGEHCGGLTTREASQKAVDALTHLLANLPLEGRLSMLGVTEDAIEKLSEDALSSASTQNNPRTPSKEEIAQLYRSIY